MHWDEVDLGRSISQLIVVYREWNWCSSVFVYPAKLPRPWRRQNPSRWKR